MKRIVIVDTYYSDFLWTVRFDTLRSYKDNLRVLLDQSFGTFDAYSRGLQGLGWTVSDIIANSRPLQSQWAKENVFDRSDMQAIALEQIRQAEPDVVFMQDLSFFSREQLSMLADHYVLAGQCSCPMPDADKVKQFAFIFTSFPHYLQPFHDLGVKAALLPLAFDPIVLERSGEQPERDIDCLCVGGMGRHWPESVELLDSVAKNIPSAQFYGYGFENAPASIRAKYQGQAWGLDMYRLLRRAKIVINRHGTVAGKYANNLRMYEATGCGAMLLTERKENLEMLFGSGEVVTYDDRDDLIHKIVYYLDRETERAEIARRGQAKTLTAHTYANRMATVSRFLTAAVSDQVPEPYASVEGV